MYKAEQSETDLEYLLQLAETDEPKIRWLYIYQAIHDKIPSNEPKWIMKLSILSHISIVRRGSIATHISFLLSLGWRCYLVWLPRPLSQGGWSPSLTTCRLWKGYGPWWSKDIRTTFMCHHMRLPPFIHLLSLSLFIQLQFLLWQPPPQCCYAPVCLYVWQAYPLLCTTRSKWLNTPYCSLPYS